MKELCSECALCCNGALFADVELLAGDDPAGLKSLGLELRTQGRKLRLRQPCACLEGTLCRIYESRPIRCRTFECRLLQRMQRDELSLDTALKTISLARRKLATVLSLLRSMGNHQETQPLNRRCASTMKAPIDLSAGDAQLLQREQLSAAMSELMELLGREFLDAVV